MESMPTFIVPMLGLYSDVAVLGWRQWSMHLLRHTQTTRVLAGLQEGIQEREREVYIDYSPHTLLEWRS